MAVRRGLGATADAHAAPAAPVPQPQSARWANGARAGELLHDRLNGQEVERAVIQPVGGALARALKGALRGERGAPLDIGRRKRAERPRDFRELQVGEVALLELVEPEAQPGHT